MTTPNNEPLRKWKIGFFYMNDEPKVMFCDANDEEKPITYEEAFKEHNALVDLPQAERYKCCGNCKHFQPHQGLEYRDAIGYCQHLKMSSRANMRCPDHELKQD